MTGPSTSATAPKPCNPIIAFYRDTGVDDNGRNLASILRWRHRALEDSHNYIQVLFPLPERSPNNYTAPIIDNEVFEAFRSSIELRGRLKDSFKKILWFFGFELHYDAGDIYVRTSDTFPRHSSNWNNPFNHNHLRITRIIRSIRILGLEEEALAFYTAITQSSFTFERFKSNNRVSARSKSYWSRAMHRQLHIAPEVEDADEDDLRIGPTFLREHELKRKNVSKEPDDSQTTQKENQSHSSQKAIVVSKELNDSHTSQKEISNHGSQEGKNVSKQVDDSQTAQKQNESHEDLKASVQGGMDGVYEEVALNKGNEALERMISAPDTIMDESMYEGELFDSSSEEKESKAERL